MVYLLEMDIYKVLLFAFLLLILMAVKLAWVLPTLQLLLQMDHFLFK